MEIEATFVHLTPSELTALIEAAMTAEHGKGELALFGTLLKNMQSRDGLWLSLTRRDPRGGKAEE